MFPFSKEKRHPPVIISNDETCQNSDIDEVNALLCTSAKVNRGPKLTEEVLDENDGLDWKTMVRCDRIHLLPKAKYDDPKRKCYRRTKAFYHSKNCRSLPVAHSSEIIQQIQ